MIRSLDKDRYLIKQKWIKSSDGTIDVTAGFPFKPGDYPWLDEIDPLFTPLSLPKFLKDHLGVTLYPKQEEDLLAIVGEDPKKTFDSGLSDLPSQGVILYGKGCLGADERLYDHLTKQTKTVKAWSEIGSNLLVDSWDGEKVVRRYTSPVYLKGRAMTYRVTLSDGRSFVATADHKCLSLGGWVRVGDLQVGHTQLLAKPLDSSAQKSDSLTCNLANGAERNPSALSDNPDFLRQNVELQIELSDRSNNLGLHSDNQSLTLESASSFSLLCRHSPSFHQRNGENGLNIFQDSRSDCRPLSHFYGGQLRLALSIFPSVAPLLSGALSRNLDNSRVDGSPAKLSPEYNPIYHESFLRLADTSRVVDLADAVELSGCANIGELSQHSPCTFSLIPHESHRSNIHRKQHRSLIHQVVSPFSNPPKSLPQYTTVIGIDPVHEADFYDLTVQETHCYFDADGILHHNSGKDYVVSCTVIWAVHVLLCLKNPAMYLGQAFGENIDVVTVAYSREQAQSVLFYKIKARLRSCGWMQQALVRWLGQMNLNITPDRYLKEGGGYVGSDSIVFPSNVRLWALPATDAAEGKNPILWVADELSAFASPVRQNQAKHIHSILTTSARTRFQSRFKGFVITYPRHKGDYAMQLYDQAIANPSGDIYAVKRATWEVNLQSTRESLQPDYDRDPEGSRCKYECDPPAAIDAFFRDPEKLILHASGGDFEFLRQQLPKASEELLRTIADRGVNPIVETDQWGDPILDGRGFPKLHQWFKGQCDRAGEAYEYFVHLDPGATGDSFGFVIGHLEQTGDGEYPMIDLAFRWHGRMFQNFGTIDRWKWFDDDVAQTEQVTACEVDFRTVREFIFYLSIARGFTIARISQDAWNSVDNKQALQKRGFAVVTRVVNKEDYDAFKQFVYNRQLAYYAWNAVILEAMKLQLHNGTKVDAPRTAIGDDKVDSHKDVTDGIAAVCRQLLLLRGEGTTFYQFPPVESIVDIAERDGFQITMTPDRISEAQAKIMQAFFDG